MSPPALAGLLLLVEHYLRGVGLAVGARDRGGQRENLSMCGNGAGPMAYDLPAFLEREFHGRAVHFADRSGVVIIRSGDRIVLPVILESRSAFDGRAVRHDGRE